MEVPTFKDEADNSNQVANSPAVVGTKLPRYRRLANLDYVECSPMLTHLHLMPPRRSFDDNSLQLHNIGRPKDRTRSRSLGAEADLLLPPIASFGSLVTSTSSTGPLHQDTEDMLEEVIKEEEPTNPVYISILYGLINAFIVLPVLMSFGSIIYRDEAFAPYMPVLIKLTVVSGMVHQICFSTLSGLPFAVGQVQDAGLIFLSSMAGDMVEFCRSRGHPDDVLLATVTVGLGLATALLGLGLVILGRLNLAQYVQMLPTPVIGGYLAYIGFFCGVSGLALMANGGGSNLSIPILVENFVFVVPGLLGGLMIYVLVRNIRHMAVLPVTIVFLLSAFYLGLLATQTTIEDATDGGWIRQSDPPPVWYRTWDFLQVDKVVWEAYPPLTLTLLSMIFVVALSSSLDVAAIELELNQPLNYNAELTMVGISNLVSGLTGGYTGSYIFSQSIFSLRAGITSRLAGYVLALCELTIFVLPIPILSFVPNFFFGSLLIMICIDLMYEWLWEVRTKLTAVEYTVCLSTFILIQVTGVEYGIILGVLAYMLCRKLGMNVGATDSAEELSPKQEAQLKAPQQYDPKTLVPPKIKYGAGV
jgi:SulP family sulfate permease